MNERIIDAGAKIVITANAGVRGGKIVPLKNTTDEAIATGGCESVESVIVYQRVEEQDAPIQWQKGRDLWWHDLVARKADYCEPTYVEADHPLFILYTSGSTENLRAYSTPVPVFYWAQRFQCAGYLIISRVIYFGVRPMWAG